jgi:hypothetical protein
MADLQVKQGSGPYCSPECKHRAPHDYFHVPSHSNYITAWAADIPSNSPTSLPNPSSSSFLPPNLLHPVPPTLSITTPRPPASPPSLPISTSTTTAALSISPFDDLDTFPQSSLLSAATDSSLATPASAHPVPFSSFKHNTGDRPSIFGTLATHVRSWVSPSTPIPPSLPRHRISAPTDSRNHNALPRPQSPHMNLTFSSPSPADDNAPVWHLSSTILVDKPSKNNPNIPRDIRTNQLPYKSRGRKLSRAVA